MLYLNGKRTLIQSSQTIFIWRPFSIEFKFTSGQYLYLYTVPQRKKSIDDFIVFDLMLIEQLFSIENRLTLANFLYVYLV
jgi:hypothetical protein